MNGRNTDSDVLEGILEEVGDWHWIGVPLAEVWESGERDEFLQKMYEATDHPPGIFGLSLAHPFVELIPHLNTLYGSEASTSWFDHVIELREMEQVQGTTFGWEGGPVARIWSDEELPTERIAERFYGLLHFDNVTCDGKTLLSIWLDSA